MEGRGVLSSTIGHQMCLCLSVCVCSSIHLYKHNSQRTVYIINDIISTKLLFLTFYVNYYTRLKKNDETQFGYWPLSMVDPFSMQNRPLNTFSKSKKQSLMMHQLGSTSILLSIKTFATSIAGGFVSSHIVHSS